MSNPFLGEIRVFPYDFAPKGWFLCDGQLLPISQYTALFSLLGTQYGGNGTSKFRRCRTCRVRWLFTRAKAQDLSSTTSANRVALPR